MFCFDAPPPTFTCNCQKMHIAVRIYIEKKHPRKAIKQHHYSLKYWKFFRALGGPWTPVILGALCTFAPDLLCSDPNNIYLLTPLFFIICPLQSSHILHPNLTASFRQVKYKQILHFNSHMMRTSQVINQYMYKAFLYMWFREMHYLFN